MFEFLFDITNDPVIYSFYIGYILSFSLNIAWVWAIEYKMTDTPCTKQTINKLFFQYTNQNIRLYQSHDVFEWLIQITKRTELPDNDDDHHSFSINGVIH